MIKNTLAYVYRLQTKIEENPKKLLHVVALLVLLLAIYLVPIGVIVWLAEEVVEGEPLAFDAFILTWIQEQQTPAATTFFQIFTELGGVYVLGGTVVATVAICWVRGYKKAAVMVGASVGGAAGINLVLKSLFQRDRPDFWQHLVTETGYSFPSGHAMASAAITLSVLFLLWRTRFRLLAVAIGGVYLLLIGISRMYLGVHYPTDIITGWFVSFIWVSVVALVLYGRTLIRKR